MILRDKKIYQTLRQVCILINTLIKIKVTQVLCVEEQELLAVLEK